MNKDDTLTENQTRKDTRDEIRSRPLLRFKPNKSSAPQCDEDTDDDRGACFDVPSVCDFKNGRCRIVHLSREVCEEEAETTPPNKAG